MAAVRIVSAALGVLDSLPPSRFVTLGKFHQNDYQSRTLNLYEVEVFRPDGLNVARTAVVSASSVFGCGCSDILAATDGVAWPIDSQGLEQVSSMFHSDSWDENPSFTLDLGEPQPIAAVRVYPRYFFPERFFGTRLILRNSTEDEGYVLSFGQASPWDYRFDWTIGSLPDTLIIPPTAPPAPALTECPPGWAGPFLGLEVACYRLHPDFADMPQARANCESLHEGATLAAFTSAEQAAATAMGMCGGTAPNNTYAYWMGLTDRRSESASADPAGSAATRCYTGWEFEGLPLASTSWYREQDCAASTVWLPGEPNDYGGAEDCVVMDNGGMNDVPCVSSTSPACCMLRLGAYVPPPPPCPAGNRIVNGDFEAPGASAASVPGWTVSGRVEVITRWAAHSGRHLVHLTGVDAGGGSIEQVVPVLPGVTYVLRWKAASHPFSNSPGSSCGLTVEAIGWGTLLRSWHSIDYASTPTELVWDSIEESFTPITDRVLIRFDTFNNFGSVYGALFDSVELVAVCTPDGNAGSAPFAPLSYSDADGLATAGTVEQFDLHLSDAAGLPFKGTIRSDTSFLASLEGTPHPLAGHPMGGSVRSVATVTWQSAIADGLATASVVPTIAGRYDLLVSAFNPGGLLAQYFATPDFTDLVPAWQVGDDSVCRLVGHPEIGVSPPCNVSALVPGLDLRWGEAAPLQVTRGGEAFPADRWSARFLGFLRPDTTCNMVFVAETEAGHAVRVWLEDGPGTGNMMPLIDSAIGVMSGRVPMTAGEWREVRVDFIKSSGTARLALKWGAEGDGLRAVPASAVANVRPFGDSPSPYVVYPGPTNFTTCSGDGPGLNGGVAGQPLNFTLTARDTNSNTRFTSGSDKFTVLVERVRTSDSDPNVVFSTEAGTLSVLPNDWLDLGVLGNPTRFAPSLAVTGDLRERLSPGDEIVVGSERLTVGPHDEYWTDSQIGLATPYLGPTQFSLPVYKVGPQTGTHDVSFVPPVPGDYTVSVFAAWQPSVQMFGFGAYGPLYGTFRLGLSDGSAVFYTDPIPVDASADLVKHAIEELPNIDGPVIVTRTLKDANLNLYDWLVTFSAIDGKLPLLFQDLSGAGNVSYGWCSGFLGEPIDLLPGFPITVSVAKAPKPTPMPDIPVRGRKLHYLIPALYTSDSDGSNPANIPI